MGDNTDYEEELCAEIDSDMSGYSKSDMILLTRTLRGIYATCRDYVKIANPSEEEREAAHTRLKQQYQFYQCNVKRKLANNRATSRFIMDIFRIIIILFMTSITMYMIYEIYKAFTGKEVKVTLTYAFITIWIVNPVWSVIKVIVSALNFQSSSKISPERKAEMDKLDGLLKQMVGCVSRFDGTVGQFVSEYENSEINEDLPSKRLKKLGDINQFVDNLRGFVYRSENPQLSANTEEAILRCYAFLKGGNMGLLDGVLSTESSEQTDEDNRMYFKSSKIVRSRAGEILHYYDVSFDASSLASYNDYFLDAINRSVRSLTVFVIKHAKSAEVGFGGDVPVRFCSDATTEALAGSDHTAEIVTHFSLLCDRLRKLKRLMLPEYEYLLKFLNPTEKAEWGALIDSFDETYNSSEDVLNVVELFLNNTEYVYRNLNRQRCELTTHEVTRTVNVGRADERSYSIMIPKFKCTTDDESDKCLTYQDEFDIKSVYVALGGASWRDKDTLLYARTSVFLRTLDKTALPAGYRAQYKVECDLIEEVLERELQFEWTVESVISTMEAQERQDPSSDGVLVRNARLLLQRLFDTTNDDAVKKLVFDRNATIDNPKLFITFDQFDEKLSNMTADKYAKFDRMVRRNADHVKFFNDRIDELNNSAESQMYMSGVYFEFVVLYAIISFCVTVDFSYKYYTKQSVDVLLMEKLQKSRLNKKKTGSSEKDGGAASSGVSAAAASFFKNLKKK